ncbi:ABC transporter substrate-binding protein [Natrialba swarupiae]|uniref:ABC transporter substrate-binding protein n=1 Tax=Natrialba swarupiae TaxID=2448032 RepID=A0A5D5AXS7_9EURY|nr:ABC transporter substrate-binding protein [Natrialba swarupiae]TYT63771.1 ABC transporter substrate-binding protein [Natrialba swarupiae]
MVNRRHVIQATALAGVGTIAGCMGGFDDEYQRTIGMPTPQSGPLATDGEAGLRASDVAIAEINEELDEEITLEQQDGEANPEIALGVARDLNDEGVPAITGTFSSDVSMALSDFAENEEIPFMTAISVDPEIVEPGDDYTFRMTGNTTQKLRGMSEFLEQEDVSGIGVIAADYAMGRSAVEFMEQEAGDYGMDLVSDAVVPMATDDFTPELQGIDTDEIDALFCPFPGGNGPTLVRQMREQDIFEEVDIVIGHDSYGMEAYRDALGDNLVDMYNWGVDLENERARQASERMQEEFGVRMDALSLPNYDAVHMLAQVIDEQDSLDPQSVRDGLAEIEYESASGWDVSFDENGDNEAFQMIVSRWEQDGDEMRNVVQYTSDVVEP